MPASLEERFWKYAERRGPDECWPWVGYVHKKDRRGMLSIRNRNISAPRVAWLVHNGEWPPQELFACHSCDNPNCVNPNHLWLGTVSDNNRDAKEKGRLSGQSLTHCKRGHPLSGDNLAHHPNGRRKCKACVKIYRQRHSVLTPEQRAKKSELQRKRRAANANGATDE